MCWTRVINHRWNHFRWWSNGVTYISHMFDNGLVAFYLLVLNSFIIKNLILWVYARKHKQYHNSMAMRKYISSIYGETFSANLFARWRYEIVWPKSNFKLKHETWIPFLQEKASQIKEEHLEPFFSSYIEERLLLLLLRCSVIEIMRCSGLL